MGTDAAGMEVIQAATALGDFYLRPW